MIKAFPAGRFDVVWTVPMHERTRINRAGAALLKNGLSERELIAELEVINNWRSAHGYPLHCIKMTLKRRAKGVDSKAIIAQRIKRLPSIRAKLSRESEMKLSQMQDIGGCRAVVSSIRSVDRLLKIYQQATAKNPKRGHQLAGIKDYIANPKLDGYRGIHLVYKSIGIMNSTIYYLTGKTTVPEKIRRDLGRRRVREKPDQTLEAYLPWYWRVWSWVERRAGW